MSPRGVAIPDVEQQLFEAAERVLRRTGPEGLNSRAVTTEAGTAKGLLYRHFADFDAFLAAFVMHRAERLHQAISRLRERAGTGTVADNLTDAALSVMPEASTLMDLVRARPSLLARLGQTGEPHASQLQEVEQTFTAYLDAERDAGRVAADTDTEAVATALIGAVQQFVIAPRSGSDLEGHIRRVVAVLVRGIVPAKPEPPP